MKTDYIIVGFGIAGASLAAILEKHNKSFIVIDDNRNPGTRVIGGMYNPVILKRFTPAWQAHRFWIEYAKPFYEEMERKLDEKFIHPFHVYRILNSVEEQNNWTVASDKPVLEKYMNPVIAYKDIPGIDAPYGMGVLQNVGRVNGALLVEQYRQYLTGKNLFLSQSFEHQDIMWNDGYPEYNGIRSKHIVFAEGAYLRHNPYFQYLPLTGTKGEILNIHIPGMPDVNIKSSVFMIATGNENFKVGATYHWDDKTREPTRKAELEIRAKLEKFMHLPYRIVHRQADIRPTVIDRRPLLGKHPELHNLSVLNGLGTRGIIFAPALAKILFHHLEYNEEIPDEMHIKRFEKLYNESKV